MARARLISTTLGSSRKFHDLHAKAGDLGFFAQALYPLIVTHADDFGRLEGDAFTIKLKVFPSCHLPDQDFARAMRAMESSGLLRLYEIEGVEYLQVLNFEAHQSGLHKRTASRFPEPPGNSRKFPEIPSEGKGREEKGIRTEGMGKRARKSSARTRPEKVSDPLLASAGVLAYREVYRYWPPPGPIREKVGAIVDVEKWSAVMSAWQARGYNPRNLDGQFEWYLAGIPERNPERKGNGLNATNKGSATPTKGKYRDVSE